MAAALGVISERIKRGDTHKFRFTVKDSLTEVAQSIAGWTFWFYTKDQIADLDVDAFFKLSTLTTGIAIVDAANGIGEVTISPANTTPVVPVPRVKRYYAELQGKDGSGNVYSLASGTLTVVPDVVIATS